MTTAEIPATKKQTWALYCFTRQDWRNMNLTLEEASELIGLCFDLKNEKGRKRPQYPVPGDYERQTLLDDVRAARERLANDQAYIVPPSIQYAVPYKRQAVGTP